jgi:HlyD family secretion protein
MKRLWNIRYAALLVAILLLATGAAWMTRNGRAKNDASAVATQPVSRENISVTVEASGTIEPVDLVEVKSKASGTILSMPVSVGSQVKANQLLLQIDARDVRNQYEQAAAALHAAQAKLTVSKAQNARANGLFAQGVITAPEHETALLDQASAEAAVVSARTDLDLAKQRLDDATVRAPIAGTILSQAVTAGQVTTSATNSVSGGTALLTMADLHLIRMRTMVSETDVGQVRPGQQATVTVDAFPNRTFQGTVEKIEPQAVVEQSVTNFPVLISLPNEQGLLLPGMNGDVSLMVDRRSDVLAVPVDAVRNLREALVLAPTLGLNADSVRAQVTRQRGGMGFGGRGMRDSLGGGARGDSTRGWRRGGGGNGGGGFGGGMSDSARAERRRAWAASGGSGGADGGQGGGQGGAGGGQGGGMNRAQVVFVKTAKGIEPRLVHLGLSDFDWAEVASGVKEGEQVLLLGIAQAQAARTEQQANVRQRVGTMPGGIGGAGGGGGQGGGGGRSRGGS